MIVRVSVTATQDETVEQAIELLVIRCQGRYFIKTDNTAIALANCSCLAEAVEYCFMSFFVFFRSTTLGSCVLFILSLSTFLI